MAGNNGYTPTEAKMLAVLSDYKDHPWKDLHACMVDDLAGLPAVRVHVCNLRLKLRKYGEEIACIRYAGCTFYRRVSMTPP